MSKRQLVSDPYVGPERFDLAHAKTREEPIHVIPRPQAESGSTIAKHVAEPEERVAFCGRSSHYQPVDVDDIGLEDLCHRCRNVVQAHDWLDLSALHGGEPRV